MEYSDFQILSDEAYHTIQNEYEKIKPFDRCLSTASIIQKLSFCKNSCKNIDKNLNLKIRSALTFCNEKLSLIIENFETCFSFNNQQQTNIYDFNIFTIQKTLLLATNELDLWQKQETKEFFKSVLNKSIRDIISILIKISESLESSMIQTYRHM